MKRFIAVLLIIMMMLAFAACSAPVEEDDQPPQTSNLVIQQDEAGEDAVDETAQKKIGFSLSGDDSFNQQLIKDIETQCYELNYEPVVKTALTAEEQKSHISNMISTGVSVIVLDPVDVDELESSLDECDTHDIPVVNAVEMANGIVSTFITPDYMAVGKSAGRDAVELYGDSEAQCLLLKTKYDSFSMQLMTDGFLEEINKDKDVSLVDEQYCGDDEELAYEAAKAAITGGEIDFIFAQSDTLALGALRAKEELNSEITLVAFGGDMNLISAAVEGTIHSCIFYGTKSLAQASVNVADRFIKNPAYLPDQYIELRIEAAQGEDAPKYNTEDVLYAQTIGG